MEKLQLREKEIFETLKKIKDFEFVIIGCYAVNPYTIPRFSVDCDLVLKSNEESKKITKKLEKNGYTKKEINKTDLPYHRHFIRYEKNVQSDINASFDLLIKSVYDRETKANFDAEWIFKNSSIILLKGKTIYEKLMARVINIDALIVMKFVSCRESDIRDVFMISPRCENVKWVKEEINKRCDFNERFNKIKNRIISGDFKDNLQGVYGKIDNKTFDRYKKSLLNINKNK